MGMPTYRTEPTNDGYVSTVTFNGNDYAGIPCRKKKTAEHSAAHVCLFKLNRVDQPPEGYQVDGEEPVSQEVPDAAKVQVSVAPEDTLKERLNEYCRAKSIVTPTCKTTTQEDGGFV